METRDKVEQLSNLIALRLLPEIRQTRRIAQVALLWQIATTTIMVSGWLVVLALYLWGVADD